MNLIIQGIIMTALLVVLVIGIIYTVKEILKKPRHYHFIDPTWEGRRGNGSSSKE